ncbi:MAG: DUF4846 domain-containing protein [Candidatus Kapabacteria bacterium]|nr:DUF4846 domain-containing protein [Candidatus Kapabacteria bacterium]
MLRTLYITLTCFALTASSPQPRSAAEIGAIPAPQGFVRTAEAAASFAGYIRSLPLSADNTVYLYNGRKKDNQDAQYAVVEMDIGSRDLQQCADAVMRIRAEYLYAQRNYGAIRFTFTSGDPAPFRMWMNGERPAIVRGRAVWRKTAKPDTSYRTFREYLTTVFRFCGTASLEKELMPVSSPQNIRIGDVIIKGGFPGHAVLVVDKAVRPSDNAVMVMLAQSYMPAQSIHVLRNPGNRGSPWYEVPVAGGALITPEWAFDWSNLKRFDER